VIGAGFHVGRQGAFLSHARRQLPKTVTLAMMREHFSQFGQGVDECVLKEKQGHASQNFGFVWAVNEATASLILMQPHVICGEQIQPPELARGRGPPRVVPEAVERLAYDPTAALPGKLFVGGLAQATTDGSMRSYFEAFGNVTEVLLPYDRVTHRSRGFGFVTFLEESSLQRVMALGQFHMLDGNRVQVKPAVSKERMALHGGPAPPQGQLPQGLPAQSSRALPGQLPSQLPIQLRQPQSFGGGGLHVVGAPNIPNGHSLANNNTAALENALKALTINAGGQGDTSSALNVLSASLNKLNLLEQQQQQLLQLQQLQQVQQAPQQQLQDHNEYQAQREQLQSLLDAAAALMPQQQAHGQQAQAQAHAQAAAGLAALNPALATKNGGLPASQPMGMVSQPVPSAPEYINAALSAAQDRQQQQPPSTSDPFAISRAPPSVDSGARGANWPW